MDDNARIANLKGFLAKQGYLKPFKYTVTIHDDVPVILFDSITDRARGRLSETLNTADLNHIQVAVKSQTKK